MEFLNYLSTEGDSDIRKIFEPHSLACDLFDMVAGPKLGSGVSRVVYECYMRPRSVIKFENARTFQNVQEWQVWHEVQGTAYEKWFAPCYEISKCGRILIQGKTRPFKPGEVPKKVPSFFTDMKIGNWGMYKGKPVCHDYGIHLLIQRGMTCGMRKFIG